MNPFNRKKFVASAEAYIEGRRQKWLGSIKGTPLEPHALKLARQDWILPNEGLDAVLGSNLFPDVDIQKVADSIESGTPEPEAKVYIANLATRNLRDVMDEIALIEANSVTAPPATQPESKEQNDPPLSGEVRGIPSEIKSSVVTRYKMEIEGHFLYTHDKALAETAKAAKAQNFTVLAVWTLGEFGCRLENLKAIDPKLIEEIIP